MARQKKLPGVDEKEKPIEELEQACETYNRTKKRLVKARKDTGDQKLLLIDLFTKHGRESYTAEDGYTYAVAQGKAKILITDPDDEGEDDDDEDAAA